jgi:hypothetical protein
VNRPLPNIARNGTAVIIGVMLSVAILTILSSQKPSMGQPLVSDDHITIRNTATSVPGVPSPGHEDHQIVMALPLTDN